MTRGSALVLFMLVFSSMVYVADEASGTASSFTEVGSTAFDVTTSGNFLSVGDWNSDGWEDLLVDGSRLYANSGPPSFTFTLTASAFSSSTAGSANGAWADFDDDGDLDLYQGCGIETADRLWQNSGPPSYSLNDVSNLYFGSWSNTGPSTGSAWCDADGDGDLDIYVGNGENWNNGDPINYADYLLINDGTSFHDGTVTAGMATGENFYSRGATWGDFNNDHLPDLYVSHYRIRENHLFVNQDNGSYTEEGRVRDCAGRYDTHVYYDATAGGVYGQYWWGPTYGHTIGSAWADFNNDGRLDLFTSDFVHKYVGWIGSTYDIRGYVCDDGKLYINDGGPWYHFEDHRQGSGIPIWPIGGSGVYQGDQTFSGVTVADFDNDGWLDLYIPQVYGDLPYTTPHLYRNRGSNVDAGRMPGTQFEDVTNINGIKGANTYANLFWDYDRDGDADLFSAGGDTWDGAKWTNYRLRLNRNEGNSNHWLRVNLQEDDANQDCIGARVTLTCTVSGVETKQTREVCAGTGHAHQQSGILHFGLGPSIPQLKMEIVWPDGTVQEMDVPSIDREITVKKTVEFPPGILDIWIIPASPHEGDIVNLSVSCESTPPSVITTYRWDIDGDDDLDMETKDPWVHFPAYNGGPARARCRATDNYFISNDRWIDFTVINDPPVVQVPDQMVNMDAPFSLPEGSISDSPSDMENMTWSIDWGDGGSVNGTGEGWAEASHIYTEPHMNRLRIICSDEDGIVDLWSKVEVVNVPPWGYIEPSRGNGTVFSEDQRISFDVHAFDTPSDQDSFEMMVDWGDGSIEPWSEDPPLEHSYAKQGTYGITVKVRDGFGGIATFPYEVTVRNEPPILFGYGPVDGIEDRSIYFSLSCNETISDYDGLRFSWDFGDGNVTGSSKDLGAAHAYAQAGDYEARCTAVDDDGADSSAVVPVHIRNIAPGIVEFQPVSSVVEDQVFTISVNATDTESDLPLLVCSIALGDGRTVEGFLSEVSYPVSGQYILTATVTDNDGEVATSTFEVFVMNRAPSAKIGVRTGPIHEDEVVEFEAEDLSDTPTDLDNLNITWDFGSGPDLYGEKVHRIFKASGNFKVKMTVSDGEISETYTRTVTVSNLPPIAKATADRTTVKAGEKVVLNANLSTDTTTDMTLLRYIWEIEGQEVPGISAEWTFRSSGSYTVRLMVTDPEGASSIDSITMIVEGDVEGDNEKGSLPILLLIVPLLLLMIAAVLLVVVIIFRNRERAVRPIVQAPLSHPAQPPVQQAPVIPVAQVTVPSPIAIPPAPVAPQVQAPVPPPPAAPVAAVPPSLPAVPPLDPVPDA